VEIREELDRDGHDAGAGECNSQFFILTSA
jgi:hypothetical protein